MIKKIDYFSLFARIAIGLSFYRLLQVELDYGPLLGEVKM
ncbi:hypothetical protein SAMN05444349_101199 [Bacteroides faecichinchillae]|uniref:Uncharacterized protein n=1 Tax=Bacteroides faecichinchillae TaxID=871325 RepID=A0A1M4SNM9_9BACE|nr:hypothetical protein SAMN05444349_101199 [Bacteroides faecichinchillae]